MRRKIAAVLLIEVRRIVQIHLRLDEHIRVDVKLDSERAVHLEMISAGDKLA